MNVANKIYEITKISFFYMTIEAVETNLIATDVSQNELWDFLEFRDYRVKLINNHGQAEIVNFEKWKNSKGQ